MRITYLFLFLFLTFSEYSMAALSASEIATLRSQIQIRQAGPVGASAEITSVLQKVLRDSRKQIADLKLDARSQADYLAREGAQLRKKVDIKFYPIKNEEFINRVKDGCRKVCCEAMALGKHGGN